MKFKLELFLHIHFVIFVTFTAIAPVHKCVPQICGPPLLKWAMWLVEYKLLTAVSK